MTESTKALMLVRLEEQIQRETNIKAGFERLLQAMQMPGEANLKNRRDIQMQLVATKQKIVDLQREMLEIQRSQHQQLADGTRGSEAAPPDASAAGDQGSAGSSPGPGTPNLSSTRHLRRAARPDDSPADDAAGIANGEAPATEAPRKDPDEVDDVRAKVHEHLDLMAGIYESLATRKSSADQVIAVLRMRHAGIRQAVPLERIVRCARYCLADPFKEMRILALRMLRHFCTSRSRVRLVFEHHVDVLLARLLLRDGRGVADERDHAFRFVRACSDVPGGAALLPQSIVRVVVAIAEAADDRLQGACAETLCELAVRAPETAALCGATRPLITAMLEGSRGLAQAALLAFVQLLDRAATRRLLRPAVELEAVVSGLTSNQPRPEDRVGACATAARGLLQTWPGLVYLCQEEERSTVRALVDSLRLAPDESQRVLVDMLFEVFRLELPPWYADFVSARGHNVHLYPARDDEVQAFDANAAPALASGRLDLVTGFRAFVAFVFIQEGLVDALVAVVQDGSKQTAARATLLVGELLEIAERLLPRAAATRAGAAEPVALLHELFKTAADFGDEARRHHATGAFQSIQNLSKAKEMLVAQPTLKPAGEDRAERAQRQADEVRLKMGLHLDDRAFQALLDQSQVPVSKDHTAWNWDAIAELVQGALHDPRRLDEALSPRTKFVKRLLRFYRPSHLQFSTMYKSRAALPYVRVGRDLLALLGVSSEGRALLASNELFLQIVQGVRDVERAMVDPAYDRSTCLFHPGRIAATLSGHYFQFVAELSRRAESAALLARVHLYDALHRVLAQLVEETHMTAMALDAVYGMLAAFDYSRDEPPRVLLARALTCGAPTLRLAATGHLRAILRLRLADFSTWALPLLVAQLYDADRRVVRAAVAALGEACNNAQCLAELVSLKPTLEPLGAVGTALQLRMLAVPEGLRQQCASGFVDRELAFWFEQGGLMQYVAVLEVSLAHALALPSTQLAGGSVAEESSDGGSGNDAASAPSSAAATTGETNVKAALRAAAPAGPPAGPSAAAAAAAAVAAAAADDREALGLAPVHLVGELSRTTEGAALLRERGTLRPLADLVIDYADGLVEDPESDAVVLALKAALWALGHAGASLPGFTLVQELGVCAAVDAVARHSSVLSVRGTCFHVLSLFSRTAAGARALDALGWQSAAAANAPALCLPRSVSRFVHFKPCEFAGSWPDAQLRLAFQHKPLDAVESEILQCIGSLSNHIEANAASRTLSRLRGDRPAYFASFPLYLEVFRLVSMYHYKLAARRYVLDLFDRVAFSREQLDALSGAAAYQVQLELEPQAEIDRVQGLLRSWNQVFGVAQPAKASRPPAEAADPPPASQPGSYASRSASYADAAAASSAGTSAKAVVRVRHVARGFGAPGGS